MADTALIFGSIGTLAETSDLQRRAFNAAFKEAGLGWHWDAECYADMVSGEAAVVGGAARILHHARMIGAPIDAATASALHASKSRLYQAMMQRDGLSANAGVAALMTEARASGARVGFASTTSRANVDALIAAIRPSLAGLIDVTLSGDDVARPKPAADIYLEMLDRLDLRADDAIAIEDSVPSFAAARDAGIACVLVPGTIWRGVAFDGPMLESLAGVDLARLVKAAGR